MSGKTLSALAAALLIFCVSSAQSVISAESFGFDNGDKQGWGMWGTGSAITTKRVGNVKPGSVFLECLTGQEATIYKKFKLTKGRYKFTAHLRAFDVGVGQWNCSFWIFYDAGAGTKTVKKDIKGTFEWSKVSWTIDVGEKELGLWFRLKAPGSAWVDDISYASYTGAPIACDFAPSAKPFPKPNPVGEGIRCPKCYRWMAKENTSCILCGTDLKATAGPAAQSKDGPEEKLLIGFEEDQLEVEKKRHYFSKYSAQKATQGKRSAVTKYAAYNNFKLDDAYMQNWSGYDYLAVDVFNPTDQNVMFATTINDGLAKGYWNQLNHYTTVSPGWSRLRFHVNRYVGERGSVRVKRYLNMKKITSMWMAFHPEGKRGLTGDFLIDNIRLVKAPPPPESFPGLQLFDFVKEMSRVQRGFIGIMSKNTYHKDVGFGFHDAQIWRAHDSLYADTLNRDGYFINGGEFRVDVLNGTYIIQLMPYALGVWNERFWTHRTIEIEGVVVLDEKRSTPEEYEKEFLRFAGVEPKPTDTAFDLYHEEVFKPIVSEVTVNDGQLNIVFNGDNAGIMINNLILYPAAKNAEGKAFVAGLKAVRQDEFKNIAVQIPTIVINEVGEFSETDKANGFYSAVVGTDKMVRFNQTYKSVAPDIKLQGGIGGRPAEGITVRNLKADAVLKASSTPLTSAGGATIEPKPEWIRYGVAQYQCHSFNHETFELAPRYLRNFTSAGTTAPKDGSMIIWYQIPISKEYKPGTYKGALKLSMHGKTVTYPVQLTVHNFALLPTNKAFGWFGLDPIVYDYYNVPGVKEKKQKRRDQVLRVLAERGFRTFSGVMAFTYINAAGGLTIDAPEIDHLMATARKDGFVDKIFTYGGGFNSKLYLDTYEGAIEGLAYEEFRKQSSAALKKHMKEKNWLPIVVDFSDEASGYSRKVERDLKRAGVLQKYYPFLRRGGFTHTLEKRKYGHDLNQLFTDVSISHGSKHYRDEIKAAGNRWGAYNNAMGLFTNDRVIGRDFYARSKYGLDHHLGWYLTLSQNLPYYDLDGRENDAMMIFPRPDGEFEYALKFEWAAQGMEDYRLLTLLEELAVKRGAKGKEVLQWLKENYQKDTIGTEPKHDVSYEEMKKFEKEIYSRLPSLL